MRQYLSLIALTVATLTQAQTIIESQGQALTEQDLKLAHSLVTFMADGAPTDKEKLTLRAGLKKEFLEDPAAFRAGVNEVKGILEEAKKLKDPMQIAFGRIALVSYYAGAVQDLPKDQVTTLLRVIFDKNPILAYDKENQIALTKKDLDASLRYLWFSNGIFEPNAEQKKQMAELGKVISTNYIQLSIEEKQFLAIGAITMAVVDHTWKKMTPEQRNQLIASYNQNYTQAQTQVQAKPLPNWSQNQNLDAGTYDFLSRMSMQNHLSMMNGINAMGGSDDYWTIRPVGW